MKFRQQYIFIIFLIGLVIISCSDSILDSDPIFTAGNPSLFIVSDSYDFGLVRQFVWIEHGFWLYNLGDGVLKIVEVKPG